MLKGMKAKRQLAAFVAIALGGSFAAVPSAYAAQSASVGTSGTQSGISGAGTTVNPYTDIVGTNLMNGSVTDNTLTIGVLNAGNIPVVNGTVSAGGTTSTTSAVTGNTLVINSISLTGNAYGGIGANIAQTSGASQTNPNVVKMNGGTVTGAVIGARSLAGGVTNGGVELAGGMVTAGTNGIAIAGGMGHTNAINNTVTLTKGTVTGAVYGGYAENAGAKTTGNNVYLGDTSGNTPTLNNASIYGGNDSDYTNNHLHVQGKGITADSARNFHTYDFHLNTNIAAGNTMLTLTNNNDAFGRAVNWSEINLDATGWSGASRTAYYGDVGTVTLMADGNAATNRSSNLNFASSSGRMGWDGDYEYRIRLDPQVDTATSTTRNYVRADLHRYMNANATYNNASSTSNTIYGGYSIWQNKVVQDNTLTITNATGTMTAYGGYTSTGADAVRNTLNMTGGTVQNLYGAYATGSGTVEDNHVNLTGGQVTNDIIGGRSAGTSATGVVRKNTVTVNNARVSGSITGGSGKTTVDENAVTIAGNVITDTVHSVVGGTVVGAYINGDDTRARSTSKNTVTITEGDIQDTVYGVFGELFGSGSSTTTYTPTVQNNSVTISGGSEKDVYGVYMTGDGSSTGIGTATNNTVEISGTARVGGTIYGAGANGDASLVSNTVAIKGGAVSEDVYGATTNGRGSVTNNIVTISEGRVHDNVIGGRSTYVPEDAGAVTGNQVVVTGGEIGGNIYGGVTHANIYSATSTTAPTSGGNTITITGGTMTQGTLPDGNLGGNIYGGYAYGSNDSVEKRNIVNLGADDGSYDADLTKATIYGGRNSYAGNTLNVKAQKPITVTGVHNFEYYNFFITKDTKADDQTPMLKLTDHNGFDNLYSGARRVNFDNVNVDLKNMSSRQIAGELVLIEGSHANALEFDNYSPRGTAAPTGTNGDYEYALRTNTDTYIGKSVLMEYNRFQNGVEAYDATSAKADWFAGLSRGGHTTEHNILTIDAPLADNIKAYGAKTLGVTGGAGGTRGNILEIKSTGTDNSYAVTEGYGGFIGNSSNTGTVENNVLRLSGGTVGTLYGGYSSGAGSVTKNQTLVTGGTVKGDIYAGWAAAAGQATNNTLTLGADDGSYSATIAGELYGSNTVMNTVGTGNTLVVQAGSEVSVKKVHNFDTFKFVLQNNNLIDKTMLKIRETGGLGGTVNWGNISVDASKFALDRTWMGSHSVKLIESNGAMTFSNYGATNLTSNYLNDPYEVYLHTNTDLAQGADVLLTVNRLRDGDRTYGATDATDADQEVFTGISAMGHDVTGNKLLLTGVGTNGLTHFATAGLSTATAGELTNNALTIDSANALTIRDAYGAYASNTSISSGSGGSGSGSSSSDMKNNSVTLLRGALTGTVYGAKAEGKRKVDGNAVTVTGGSVTGAVYGGYSVADDAENNKVDLSAVTISGDVVGGYGVNAKNNIVTLRGTTVAGTVYGGRLTTGASAAVADTNVLNVYDMGTQVGYFEDVSNLNFYLSPQSDPARTMLTTTQARTKDISNTTIGIEINGDHAPIKNGDVVSLIKLPDAQNLVTASNLASNTYQTTQGVTLNYTFGLETRGALANQPLTQNELIARVKSVTVNENSKSLVETQAAAIAFLASGSDLIADVGIPAAETAAMQIADIVDTPYAGSEKNSAAASAPLSTLGSYQMFAAQSFGNMRLKSGSYVDTKGWGLNVGYARRSELLDSSLTFGPFIEYGRGSYDSYLDNGTHGDGTTSYLGIGVMAKVEKDTGLYYEGSLRVGRAKSDYTGTVGTRATSYDGSANYVAGHLGIGQKKEFLSGNKLETYAKYFYAHQAGTSAKLSSDETYDFGASTSSRIRFGTRYTFKNDMDGEFYAGLAWEYEFDGKSTASFQGFDLPSTSLKGSTTLFELGYRFAPVDSTVSYGLNLTGFKGKRKGFTGGFNIAWAF